jgi:hypothetical protein
MPARPLVMFPDPRLRRPALPITEFGEDVHALARDLLDTLEAVQAIGITAPHIGVLQRAVVVRLEPGAEAITYCNPEITWTSPELASTRKEASQCPTCGRASSAQRGSGSLSGHRGSRPRCGGERVPCSRPPARVRPTRRSVLDRPAVPVEAERIEKRYAKAKRVARGRA